MTAVFADTFYWIALTIPEDAGYERAQQVTDDIVTTEEVLKRVPDILLRGARIPTPESRDQCAGHFARPNRSRHPAEP